MKRTIITAAALAGLLLAGCSNQEPAEAAPSEEAPYTSVPSPVPTDVESEVPGGTVGLFGTTLQIPGSISASVLAQGYSTVAGAEDVAVLEIRVGNLSASTVEIGDLAPSVTYGKDRTVPAAVADEAAGIGGTIGDLLPGEERTVLIGLKVPVEYATDLRVEIADPAGGEPAVFLGAVPNGL